MSHLGIATALPAKTPASARRRTIPFDYQFYFRIEEDFLNEVMSATLTVSIEAAFVAVSIGYGFVPRVRTFAFGPEDGAEPNPAKLQLGNIIGALQQKISSSPPKPGGGGGIEFLARAKTLTRSVNLGSRSPASGLERVLIQGIQINPVLLSRFLQALQGGGQMAPDEMKELFQAVEPPPERVQFLYALSDKGSGRFFQSEPLLNIAGLGISDGDRPFRYFATPIVFPPRSTIQLDVIPKTDFRGELYVTLHGYKVLGGAGTPTGHKLRGPAQATRMRRP